MSVAAKLTTLAARLTTYRTTLLAAINAKVDNAIESQNATRVDGKTEAEYKQPITNSLNAHLSSTNPHGVTLEQLNAYSEEEINALYSTRVLQGTMPISKFYTSAAMSYLRNANNYRLRTTNLIVVISGRFLQLSGNYDWAVDNIPVNSQAHVYAVMNAGVISLKLSVELLNEEPACMYIGSFTVTNTATVTMPYFGGETGLARIDTARISSIAAGQSIPVSSTTDKLNWK